MSIVASHIPLPLVRGVSRSAARRSPPAGASGLSVRSRPGSAAIRAASRSNALAPLADSDGGSGGFNGGGDGGGSSGGGGGDGFFGRGGSGLALGAAVPVFGDFSKSFSLTAENLLLLLACIVLPVLGVYLYRNNLDKYVLTTLVLTFLPPIGIIFATAHVFFDFRPL